MGVLNHRASELCALSLGELWRGDNDGKWWLSATGKGSKSYRLEIHADAVAALRLAHRTMYGNRKRRPEEPLMVNADGGRLNRQLVWYRVAGVGKKLKAAGQVRKDLEFSPHLLRRTLCTSLLKQGMDLNSVQAISRQADATRLLTHYVDGGESAAPILDGLFKGLAA